MKIYSPTPFQWSKQGWDWGSSSTLLPAPSALLPKGVTDVAPWENGAVSLLACSLYPAEQRSSLFAYIKEGCYETARMPKMGSK